MKRDEKMVCKHCGGDDFYANVTVTSAWVGGTGVFVGDDGKPHFEPDGRVEDTYDWDVDEYVCNGCERSSMSLDKLVVPAPKNGADPIAPCARCDHARVDHPELGWKKEAKPYYTRGPMPCEHEGCDCHDYFEAPRGVEAVAA